MKLAEVLHWALLAGKPGVVYGTRTVRVRWPMGELETVREASIPEEPAP